ncbi:MAG: class I SAM-dependent methyltransferase [Actinobacteria bacterium]|nr:class I SAM-dependent methyltransferase [Actinomycetota bacterium]
MDREKIEAFLDRFVGFASGAAVLGLLAVADRSGLSSYLAENPSGTAAEIAEGARLEERYVREILAGLAAAGVVEYDPGSGVFELPAEHALFIADDTSPYFMGGWMDMIPSAMTQIEGVANATVHGGGVGFEEFGGSMIRGIDRGNSPSQKVFLTSRWLPAVPGLVDRLEKGIRVADVGCGSGTAALAMAAAFPESRVFGYDVSQESLAVARGRAEGVPNVEFHIYAADEIPARSAVPVDHRLRRRARPRRPAGRLETDTPGSLPRWAVPDDGAQRELPARGEPARSGRSPLRRFRPALHDPVAGQGWRRPGSGMGSATGRGAGPGGGLHRVPPPRGHHQPLLRLLSARGLTGREWSRASPGDGDGTLSPPRRWTGPMPGWAPDGPDAPRPGPPA